MLRGRMKRKEDEKYEKGEECGRRIARKEEEEDEKKKARRK